MGVGEFVSFGTLALGVWGVWSWRRQLHGTARFNAARDLLRSATRLADSIHDARNPFMGGGEILAALEASPAPVEFTREERDEFGTEAATARRTEIVRERANEFSLHRTDAAVIWGRAMDDACAPLWRVAAEFFAYVQAWVRTRRERPRGSGRNAEVERLGLEDPRSAVAKREERRSAREQRYLELVMGDRDDVFGRRISGALRGLDVRLRPFLGPELRLGRSWWWWRRARIGVNVLRARRRVLPALRRHRVVRTPK